MAEKAIKVEDPRDVRDFVTRVGMAELMNEVGVKPAMVRHAARQNRMPARWFNKADRLAREKGTTAPRELFDFS